MKIPRDLKPGDKIIDRNGNEYNFERYHDKYEPVTAECDPCASFKMDGHRLTRDLGPCAIRIERITSKPKKVKPDRDAVWLLFRWIDCEPGTSQHERRRLRAIAKRLNGGKKL